MDKASENVEGNESHGTAEELDWEGRKGRSRSDARTLREFLSNVFYLL